MDRLIPPSRLLRRPDHQVVATYRRAEPEPSTSVALAPTPGKKLAGIHPRGSTDALIVYSVEDYTTGGILAGKVVRKAVYRAIHPIAPEILSETLASLGLSSTAVNIPSVTSSVLSRVRRFVLLSCNATLEYPLFYELARKIRDQRPDLLILMGGVHVGISLEAVTKDAEGLFIPVKGRGELILPEILEDAEQGTLKASYESAPANFKQSYLPPKHQRHAIDSLELSVGCPDSCSFCSAILSNPRFSIRPIAKVIEELDQVKGPVPLSPWKNLFFTDDNLTALPNAFLHQLFDFLAKKRILWMGEGSLYPKVLADEELLRKMGKTCTSFLAGVEDLSGEHVSNSKKTRAPSEIVSQLDLLYSHNVPTIASIVVGLDNHTKATFKRLSEVIIGEGIVPAIFLATPYPGTRWYAELEAEGRILDHDLTHYDTRTAVFEPPGMSAKELQEGYEWLRAEVVRHKREIFKKITKKGVTSNKLLLWLQYFIVCN